MTLLVALRVVGFVMGIAAAAVMFGPADGADEESSVDRQSGARHLFRRRDGEGREEVGGVAVSVTQAGEAGDGVIRMSVSFTKGDEVMRSVDVSVRSPTNYGSGVGLSAAAAMKVQECFHDLSDEMQTVLAKAIGHWLDLRTIEVRGK